jgi:hypothetical protein
MTPQAPVAQPEEHLPSKQRVGGSSPSGRARTYDGGLTSVKPLFILLWTVLGAGCLPLPAPREREASAIAREIIEMSHGRAPREAILDVAEQTRLASRLRLEDIDDMEAAGVDPEIVEHLRTSWRKAFEANRGSCSEAWAEGLYSQPRGLVRAPWPPLAPDRMCDPTSYWYGAWFDDCR